jgi:ABC-2 type transport system ATP-binding protein
MSATADFTAVVADPATPVDSSGPAATPHAAPPPLPDAILVCDHLRVSFDKLTAVRDVSFRLNSGDLLGLIGPNGAGKTTLLRTLCGLQPLSAGHIHLMGESLTPQRNDLLAHVGFTPDTPALYDELTVRQFLRFIGKGYGLASSDVDERIDFWLAKVWLTEKAETKIKTLSRGMKQRVGIARTLLPNPALVLLDEPAAGLDPAGRVQFRQLLCDLRDQGKAMIVSSHILSDMADYCTHVGIMAAGTLVRVGTVADVTNMHGDARCRYTLRLARPVAALEPMLSQIPGVTHVAVERLTVILEFTNTPDAAAELLAELIHRRLPIAAFSANAIDLEEAYLRVGIGQVD